MVHIWLDRLILAIFFVINMTESLKVLIDTLKPHARVEKEFLSVALDAGWQNLNLSNPRMKTLLRGLSPAYLRLGGASADRLVYSNQPTEVFSKVGKVRLNSFNASQVDLLVDVVRSVKFKILMDLNLQLRYGTEWDPTNAISLLGHINAMGYKEVFNFELGNEPNLYHSKGPEYAVLNGTRIGEDFLTLHNALAFYNLTNCTFVGPDTTQFHDTPLFKEIFTGFLQIASKILTAATFHHYYLDGPTATVSDFINATVFDFYKERIEEIKGLIKDSPNPDLPIWLGEGADAKGGGAPNISNTFASGFLWLEKLGLSAKEGMGVVVRQTLIGTNYGLISGDEIHPAYWLSYVHKQLVGQTVLNVTLGKLYMSNSTVEEVRVYAHCAKRSSRYQIGSVTVFALNVQKFGHETLTFSEPLSKQKVHIYLLTPSGPGGLQARLIGLNGQTLELLDDHTLPELVPVQQSASQGIKLPALTFGFFVFPDANAVACK